MIARGRGVLAIVVVVVGCTTDLRLGARETACDPAAETCTCATTADCPDHFYCIATTNTGLGTCQPPQGCTALPMRRLDCPGASCNPSTDPICNPAPVCENANACPNGDGCCTGDLRCYPLTCRDCCE